MVPFKLPSTCFIALFDCGEMDHNCPFLRHPPGPMGLELEQSAILAVRKNAQNSANKRSQIDVKRSQDNGWNNASGWLQAANRAAWHDNCFCIDQEIGYPPLFVFAL